MIRKSQLEGTETHVASRGSYGLLKKEKTMKAVLAIFALMFAVPLMCEAQQPNSQPGPAQGSAQAQTAPQKTAPAVIASTAEVVPNSVFISPMNGFESYLAAALQKKKVPLTIVADQAHAAYIITGTSDDKKPGWAKMIVFGQIHSDNAASIQMIDQKTTAVVFAYAVNKKNTLHGDQTTAEACAKHLKEKLEKR